MYNNIPVGYTIDVMAEHLAFNNVLPKTIAGFRSLISMCHEKNGCAFQNEGNKFLNGLSMGGPLSSAVAVVFKDKLEWDVFSTAPSHQHVGL